MPRVVLVRSEFISRFIADLRCAILLFALIFSAQPGAAQAGAKTPGATRLQALLDQAQEALGARRWQEAGLMLKQAVEWNPRR